ncbi:MAG: DUF2300 domain-containing protein [Pseudomonadota bacterium]
MLTAAALALAAGAPLAATLDLAWWRQDGLHAVQLRDDGAGGPAGFDASREVPLGSLWKLFVYVYAVDTGLPTPDYACAGQDREEVYCCDAGGRIGRDAALAQSCGLFFAPARLLLARAPWQRYWSARLGRSASGQFDWLADPARLTPQRLISLGSLLRALASVPPAARADAESALLHVVLDGRAAGSARWFGSRLRVKTYSWHQAARPAERLGGAAGWLADGTPLWFGAAGGSSAVFQKWSAQLSAALPDSVEVADAGCVLVDYFARYPIKTVKLASGAAAVPGALRGPYRVLFENGNSVTLRSEGESQLWMDDAARPHVRGRLGVNEYVARVLEREGGVAEPEAAKALAIAARSYLQQNAQRAEGCQRIADSSATQRVGASPAGPAARAVARWTDQLVVAGVTVRYHATTPGNNTMAWRDALAQARRGDYFDAILAHAYPDGELATINSSGVRCVRLAGAESWLARQLPEWERLLRGEPGYERPGQMPAVCELGGGAPYSEQSRNRIFVSGLATREDRITLAHEFLHLGLRNHPRGQDEVAVERLARRLTDFKLEQL